MSSSSLIRRGGRRPALVAGAVAAVAVVSVAGSLVPGATAAPAPAAARPVPAAAPAQDAGPNARTMSGREVTVRLSSSALARRTAAGAAAVASPTAGRAAAAAAVKPPAVVAVGTTGIVASSSASVAYSPDGSRVAWLSAGTAYSAHPNGTGLLPLLKSSGLRRLSWSPDGRFVAFDTNSGIRVLTAADPTVVARPGSGVPSGTEAVSWVDSSTLVTLRRTHSTMEIVPLFGGKVRTYKARQVVDAVGSPDGTKVAAVVRKLAGGSPVGQSLVVIDTATLQDVATVVTTSGVLGRPAWSRDSATVYVPRTESGTTSVLAHAAATAEGDPTVVMADAKATPRIYRRPAPGGPAVGLRLTGDPVATTVARSKTSFPIGRARSCDVRGGATAAVLARSGSIEATIAGPLAAHTCGPVLLTGNRSLDRRTAAELSRLLSRGRTVYLVGGTSSLSASVATSVTKLGFRAVRYAGRDVPGTAVQVALKGWKNRGAAVISSAAQPMAAVAAASFAGVADVPLLLTNGTTMPAVTQAHIRKYDVGAWAIGSQGVKAAPWATPYRGADDAGTSLLVAKKVFYPPNAVALVVAGALPDAYVAAAETAAYGYPVLVVTPGALTKAQRTYLDANSGSLNLVHLFGSTRRVSSRVLTDAVRLAAGRIDW